MKTSLPPAFKPLLQPRKRVASAPAPIPVTDMGKPNKTPYMANDERSGALMLTYRPSKAPTIFDEFDTPIKLICYQHQAPGDALMFIAAIRDLHMSYPKRFVTDMRLAGNSPDLLRNNPHNTLLPEHGDPSILKVRGEYTDSVKNTNIRPTKFICAFHKDLEDKLGIRIIPTTAHSDVYLSAEEKSWRSQIWEMLKKDVPFWLINAGTKLDYTCKHWEVARFQDVVTRLPDITFVQVGMIKPNHQHTPLTGDNVINLLGKTNTRQLCRLVYWSAGVITPVSFLMHLSAAIEPHPMYKRNTRPCIVIAGGREGPVWESYNCQQYLHTCGKLPCCSHGGCWKARIIKQNDGDSKDNRLCKMPVKSASGQMIPKCMDMITADDVVRHVNEYLEAYSEPK